MFCHDRSRHGPVSGGGVLIFVHDDLQVTHRSNLSTLCDELLWLEFCPSVGPLLFGVFYHPPNQDVDNLVALNNSLLSVYILLSFVVIYQLLVGFSHFLQFPYPLLT